MDAQPETAKCAKRKSIFLILCFLVLKRCLFTDADYSAREEFIRNLKKDAEAIEVKIGGDDLNTIVENVVRFDNDKLLLQYCKALGLLRMNNEAELIFLLRREYHAVWDEIKTQLKAITGENQFIVTGTAGIGKSAFRFFVLREWLRADDKFGFQSVVFDEGKEYYRVDQNGSISTYVGDLAVDMNSIFVLNPCEKVDKVSHLTYGLTIITSSPSAMTNQPTKHNIRDLRCEVLVLNAWTESEIISVSPSGKYDIDRFRKFSYLTGGERYCIPRWLTYTDGPGKDDARIEHYYSQSSAAALQKFLKSNVSHVKDMDMPYSLCVIEDVPGSGWAATGFISAYVAKSIHKWVNSKAVLDKTSFVELLRNPFSHGLFGGIFEDWMHTALGKNGKVLRFSHGDKVLEFQFSGIQSYAWSRKKNGKVLFPELQLEDKIFFKPDGVDSPSIDGYGIHDDFLLLIQATVGLTHSGAKLLAVEEIITAARFVQKEVKIYMVYVVPQAHLSDFRPPTCRELVDVGVTVCVGVITDDDDLIAKYSSELS
jgi:hypothetical protein